MKDEQTQAQWKAQQEQEFTQHVYCMECGEEIEMWGRTTPDLYVCPHCGAVEGDSELLYRCSLCLEEHEDEECNCYMK